jgi:enamine deaminase RidA (YjgF/YER057c/UK114 family)
MYTILDRSNPNSGASAVDRRHRRQTYLDTIRETMRTFRFMLAVALVGALAEPVTALQKKRKKKEVEEITQTLDVPKDPPAAIAMDPKHMGFLIAPMSSKGLLSAQTRDGLKALRSLAKGAPIVKIRAFVAGTGDLRRVQAIVSDQFTEWRQPIPALTTIQVGVLPQENSQVLLEGVVAEKKAVNPNGVALFSGQQVTSKEVLEKVEPIFRQSIDNLNKAVQGANVAATDVVRVTCFTSALGDYLQQRQIAVTQFPKAALTIVQTLRGLSTALVECEAVGRLSSPPASPLVTLNPPGLTASPNYSQAILLNAPKVILSGGQLAFQAQDSDIRLAFERLKKALEQAGGSLRNVAMTNYYPLTNSTIDKIRNIRFDFLDKGRPPASTMLLFEGLPSMDASFAMEVIALP